MRGWSIPRPERPRHTARAGRLLRRGALAAGLVAAALAPAAAASAPPAAAAETAFDLVTRCPTAAEVAAIDDDLNQRFEGDPSAPELVCTDAQGSADLTLMQRNAYTNLLAIRRMSFVRPQTQIGDTTYAIGTGSPRAIAGVIDPDGGRASPTSFVVAEVEPPAADVGLTVRARRRQRVGRLKVRVGCASLCAVALRGKVVAKRKRIGRKGKRTFRIRSRAFQVDAGERRVIPITLRHPNRSMRRLRRLLRRKPYRRHSRATFRVRAVAAGGISSAKRVRVTRLRP